MLGRVTFKDEDGNDQVAELSDDGRWSCAFNAPEFAEYLNDTAFKDDGALERSYSPADGFFGAKEVQRVAELVKGRGEFLGKRPEADEELVF